MTPLEEIAQPEVQLPFGIWPTERIHAVEPVGPVESEWTEGRDDLDADPRAAEQPRGIELVRAVPQVARVEEEIGVEHLVEADAELRRRREEHVAERRGLRLSVVLRARIVSLRRDRELVVAAQHFTVLRAAQRELL